MKNQKKSLSFFQQMGSKIVVLIGFIFLVSSCWWDPDHESIHQLRIENATNDTIVFSLVVRHLCPSCEVAAEDAWELFPDDNIIIGTDVKLSGFDLINDYCGSQLDTAIVYKIASDSLNSKKINTLYGNSLYVSQIIRWGGPLVDLPDSINSFYNKNSWIFSKNPNNKKMEVATFRITEKDLKQID